MKGRFRDFLESLVPSKKKDNFLQIRRILFGKNRFITFLQRFVLFVNRRAHTKLILGQQHEGDSGHVGFHHRKTFRRVLRSVTTNLPQHIYGGILVCLLSFINISVQEDLLCASITNSTYY